MKKLLFCALLWPLSLHAQSLASLVTQFQSALHSENVIIPLALAMVAGFLTALSPCVYPLIPITLGVMGARKYPSKVHGFFVALSYTLGMALVYSVLGIIFASIGLVTGSLMQQPIVLMLFALIFFLMSLSMFGLFRIDLPHSLSRKLSHLGGQGMKGAFLMGLVAGFLAAPCTGPVLGVILTIIAEQKDILWGLSLMLAFSLGMGAPFLLLGTFSSALLHLPKSGGWMDKIKLFLGALMMGVALYYLKLAWPSGFMNFKDLPWAIFFGIGMLLIMSFPLFNRQGTKRLQMVLGVGLLSISIAAALSYEEAPKSLAIKNLSWHMIDDQTKDLKTLDRLLKKAEEQRRPVLIDFYADWCKACKELETHTFSEAEVSEHLQKFMLIRVDSTRNSEYLTRLQRRFQVMGLPTVVLLSADLENEEKIVGFLAPQQLLPLLKKIVN